MKVLFAVNNDNVSEAIAKKYEREYKEVLTYKNVYYFNAIIRELQKDKTYNRVVISEDLEPFASNNYDRINNFLLEKYTNISREAKTLNEERIEIILLCADRRRKSEELLAKIYNLEIYNAIIGQDRSIEEVCRLIHSPREKNDARAYYNIQVSDLNGDEDNENSVSEAEVENILAHYKRLGKNEDKYVDSFNNIISQYTDTQLKIIIRYLPINVKAVLEEKSPKYQQLVTSGGGISNQDLKLDAKANKYKQKLQKRNMRRNNEAYDEDDEEEDPIIDKEFTQPKLTQPIVIPSDMKVDNAQAMGGRNSNEDDIFTAGIRNANTGIEQPMQQQPAQAQPSPQQIQQQPTQAQTVPQQTAQPQPTQSSNFIDLFSEINNTTEPVSPSNTARPVMPERPAIPETQIPSVAPTNLNEQQAASTTEQVFEPSTEPKTEQVFEQVAESAIEQTAIPAASQVENAESEPAKRGRGRPRKYPVVEVDPNQPKRGRGRPRKQVEEVAATTPEVDLFNMDEPKPVAPEHPVAPTQTVNPTQTVEAEQPARNVDLFNMDGEAKPVAQTPAPEVDLFNMDEDIIPVTQPQTATPNIDLFSNMEEAEPTRQTPAETAPNSSEVDLFNVQSNTNTIQETSQNVESPIQREMQYQQHAETDLFNMYDDNIENSNASNIMDEVNMTTTNRMTTSNLNTLLTSDKKIVAFVGTTKNGTSFVVNNTAELLASMGISTAILDMTKTKNAYYIYTNNEEELRRISTQCIKNLENGIAEGIRVNKSLTVYTEMPGGEEQYNIDKVLATLVQSYSAILIDTDFDTPDEIFDRVQELYLVQSMDVLTIQPLTAFLRNLKSKNILQPDKLRVVINKSERVRSLNVKTLIGGMSCYNAPSMSYMTELFDKDNIRYCEIPFEVQNYVKYLDSLVNCSISLNGYTKTLMASLKELANIVYPLVNKPNYSPMNGNKKDPFSKQMSNTLNKMKNKGY